MRSCLPVLLGIDLALFGALGVAASPAGTVADPGQITAPSRADVSAGQIGAPTLGPASAPRQLTGAGARADAPPPLSTPSQGRNTAVAVVKGHDRCDPVPGVPAEPDCERIADRQAEQRASQPPSQTPTIANTESDSASLVNSIVTGGTGTVVNLPPATPDAVSDQGDATGR
jgi:hypothetical protein